MKNRQEYDFAISQLKLAIGNNWRRVVVSRANRMTAGEWLKQNVPQDDYIYSGPSARFRNDKDVTAFLLTFGEGELHD